MGSCLQGTFLIEDSRVNLTIINVFFPLNVLLLVHNFKLAHTTFLAMFFIITLSLTI